MILSGRIFTLIELYSIKRQVTNMAMHTFIRLVLDEVFSSYEEAIKDYDMAIYLR